MVLKDLALLMKTDVINDCEAYTLQIPHALGEGIISGIGFPSGIGIITYSCRFKHRTRFIFNAREIHPAKFLYVTEGKLEHGLINNAPTRNISQHQCAIVASGGTDGHILIFPENDQVNLCSIEIDRNKFVAIVECDIAKLENPLKELFLDKEALQSFYHDGNYNLKLFDMIREMELNSHKGLVQYLVMMSITAGILSEQIIQYEKDINQSDDEYRLRRDDVELVKRAVLSITINLDNPDNIEQLAKILSCTPAKLQQSFKMIYGTTVNGHTLNVRLIKAAEMLVTSNKTVSEIVGEVGLVNRGYFSKLFRERYDNTPKEYRMKFEKKYNETN